jgi:hypothetical protein
MGIRQKQTPRGETEVEHCGEREKIYTEFTQGDDPHCGETD